jgi:hypothetical protein
MLLVWMFVRVRSDCRKELSTRNSPRHGDWLFDLDDAAEARRFVELRQKTAMQTIAKVLAGQ